MITRFKLYINEGNYNTFSGYKGFDSKLDYIHYNMKRVVQELEDEFSKHLPKIKAFLSSYGFRNNNNTIFLLDNDYGVVIHQTGPKFDENKSYIFNASIYTAYFNNNVWTLSTTPFIYTEGKETVENFVKNYINNLEKQNIKRIKNKEKRELVRAMKKYNVL